MVTTLLIVSRYLGMEGLEKGFMLAADLQQLLVSSHHLIVHGGSITLSRIVPKDERAGRTTACVIILDPVSQGANPPIAP